MRDLPPYAVLAAAQAARCYERMAFALARIGKVPPSREVVSEEARRSARPFTQVCIDHELKLR